MNKIAGSITLTGDITIKRLLVMSTALGAVGLAAYAFMPVSAGAVQWSAGFSGIPAAFDSDVIPIKDPGAGPGGGGGGRGAVAGGGGGGKQFQQRNSGGGVGRIQIYRQMGSGGGSWKKFSYKRHGHRHIASYWRDDLYIDEPYITDDLCYDYVRVYDIRKGRWVKRWEYVC